MIDELTAKLIQSSHNESVRINQLCADARERAAFNAAFAYGLEEGRHRELLKIQRTLGIESPWNYQSSVDEYWGQFKKVDNS